MRLCLIGDLITHAGGERELSAIREFRVELALETEQNMAFLAPMVGEVAGRVFQKTNPNMAKLPSAPKRFAGGAYMFRDFNGAPVGGAEGNIGDLHGSLGRGILAADVAHLDLGAGFSGGEQACAFVAVAIFAPSPNASDVSGKFGVIGTGAQTTEHVPTQRREKTGKKFTVGRKSRAMAVAAKWFGDGTDQANLAAPVSVAVTCGNFAAISGADRLEWPTGRDTGDEFPGGHDAFGRPVVGVADVHELDEAQRVSARTEIFAQLEKFAVIHAALDDAVNFYRQAEGCGGIDAAQDAGDAKAETVEFSGGGVIEGVDGDIDAIKAGGAERGCEFFEEPTVSGESDIGQTQVVFQRGDEVGYIWAQERFAAGETDFFDAEQSEGSGDAGEFAEGHELRIAQERVARAEDLFRHAIRATKIATVGHRDA